MTTHEIHGQDRGHRRETARTYLMVDCVDLNALSALQDYVGMQVCFSVVF